MPWCGCQRCSCWWPCWSFYIAELLLNKFIKALLSLKLQILTFLLFISIYFFLFIYVYICTHVIFYYELAERWQFNPRKFLVFWSLRTLSGNKNPRVQCRPHLELIPRVSLWLWQPGGPKSETISWWVSPAWELGVFLGFTWKSERFPGSYHQKPILFKDFFTNPVP